MSNSRKQSSYNRNHQMITIVINMFNNWLIEQLREKEWTQSDLAQRSGLTRGAISNYINGRIPDKSALQKIGKALKIPSETVFRAAGILPEQTPETELIEKITHITKQLPPQEQEEILEFAKLQQHLFEKREKDAAKRITKHSTITR